MPEHIINSPKKGFSIPMNDWLNNSLKEWAEDLLSVSELKNQGIITEEEFNAKKKQILGL